MTRSRYLTYQLTNSLGFPSTQGNGTSPFFPLPSSFISSSCSSVGEAQWQGQEHKMVGSGTGTGNRNRQRRGTVIKKWHIYIFRFMTCHVRSKYLDWMRWDEMRTDGKLMWVEVRHGIALHLTRTDFLSFSFLLPTAWVPYLNHIGVPNWLVPC